VLQPFDVTSQQRQEELEVLADILLCVYMELTPEQKAEEPSEVESIAA
jgi:hypothetical protein